MLRLDTARPWTTRRAGGGGLTSDAWNRKSRPGVTGAASFVIRDAGKDGHSHQAADHDHAGHHGDEGHFAGGVAAGSGAPGILVARSSSRPFRSLQSS